MHKIIGVLLLSLFVTTETHLSAKNNESDYAFNQERMIVDHGEIYLVSTFEAEDGLTAYNFNGQRLWEVKFHARILSWNVQPDVILVFSKDRAGTSTYLTCLKRTTGRCLWEKP